VAVGGVPRYTYSGPARVAATSAQSVFVGLTGEGQPGACSSCLGQLNLAVNPPVLQPATQPEVTSITGAPLLRANASGDQVFVAFGAAPGSPLTLWQASAPDPFTVSSASTAGIGASAEGTMFATQHNSTAPASGSAAEMHSADLSLAAVPAAAELAQYPSRTFVPRYRPASQRRAYLSAVPHWRSRRRRHARRHRHPRRPQRRAPPPHPPPAAIRDRHRRPPRQLPRHRRKRRTPLRHHLHRRHPAKFRRHRCTACQSPAGHRHSTLAPANGPAAGGATITIRGSGFVSGATVTIGGKSATTAFKDANTLTIVTPSLTIGAQQVQIKNPDGQLVSSDAAFIAN
jgi:hypothetical protein